MKGLVKRYGKHVVYSDGGTWYPEACAARYSLISKEDLHYLAGVLAKYYHY